jgi:hypothetical protein
MIGMARDAGVKSLREPLLQAKKRPDADWSIRNLYAGAAVL